MFVSLLCEDIIRYIVVEQSSPGSLLGLQAAHYQHLRVLQGTQ